MVCCSAALNSLMDPNSFNFQFLASLLALYLITCISCTVGCTVTFIGTGTLLVIGSWYITKYVRKTWFHETIDVSKKAVFVTGCDSGFGHRLANRLNGLGFTVFAACLDPNGDGPQSLLKTAANPKATKLIQMDVTSDEDVQRAYKEVETTLGKSGHKLWAIVNNAGIFKWQYVEWGKLEDYQKVIDINVIGLARVTRTFLPLLRKSKGRVVNVASIAGRLSGPGLSIYTISKHSVVAFSTALRREMLPWGVKVSTIEPAIYKTPMADEERLVKETRKAWDETSTSVKEDYGEEYFRDSVKTLLAQDGRDNPEEVVDALQDAIIAVEPEIRYKVCGLNYHSIWFMNDYLPFSIFDCIAKLRTTKTKPTKA